MSKLMRKLTSVVLAALMVLSLAACGGSSTTTTAAAGTTKAADATTKAAADATTTAAETTEAGSSFEHDPNLNDPGPIEEDGHTICKEQIKLTIGVSAQTNVEDFETNAQTLWIEEHTNIDLEFIVYPAGELQAQINLAIADGGSTLPDIIWANGISDAVVESWGQAGGIIALDDYYENSAYYLTEAIERTGVDFMSMITASDGHNYYVPTYNQSLTNEYGAKLFIYQPWLDELGLEAPTTPTELYEVLKAFKEQDANGNGKQDEIGLMAQNNTNWNWFECIMCAFQYVPLVGGSLEQMWDVNDGVVSTAYTTEGFREGLKYMNKLYSEGLISDAIFTDDSSAVSSKLCGEEVICGAFIGPSMSAITSGTERRIEYTGIAPLTSEDGSFQYASWKQSTANCGAVVTSNCEYPEAAFRFLDACVSENMSIWTRWGEPEVDWVVPSADEKGMFEAMGYPAIIKDILNWGILQNKHWYQAGPYIRQYAIALGLVWNGDPANTSYQTSLCQDYYTDKHPDETIAKLVYTAEESEIVTPIQESIKTYLQENIAGFITGSNGLDINKDADWQAFVDELKNIGSEKVLEVVQGVYDRMYK